MYIAKFRANRIVLVARYKSRGYMYTYCTQDASHARVNMPENVETTAVRLDYASLQPIRLP